MLNSTIVANINGGLTPNQKVSSALRSSMLLPVDFAVTEVKTNISSTADQRRFLQKNSKGVTFNGQSRTNSSYLDQNRNPQAKQHRIVNGVDNSEEGIPVPKVYLYSGRINSEWQQVHKIGAGLMNLGNTCFMNTVLQCLTYCPPLANYLLHDSDHASKCRLTGFCMMCELQQHMKRAIGRSGDIIKPIQIYQKLQSIAKHFQFGRQEDAHEFLRYLIDNLWKSSLSNYEGYSKLDPASKETTVINLIFGGYHRSQVTCLRCKEKSNTYDHFMDLMLDVKQNVPTLEKALDKFIQPELLQNENAYKCPHCEIKVSAQKKFTVFKAPNVATFQFKRFDYHRMCGGKITKHIAYPENFNLRPYMSNPKGNPVTYRLNAVLVHTGATCNSGHYYCYVKNSNGFWYIMDDSRVQQVSLNQVLNQLAYVLFYVRVSPTDTVVTKKSVDHAPGSMRNGFIGPGHCMPSTNGISRSSLSVKSPAMRGMAKLSVSTPANTLLTANNSTKLLAPPKGVINGNTLVPYIEDSSDFTDEDEANDNSQVQTKNFPVKKIITKQSSPSLKDTSGKDKDKPSKNSSPSVFTNGIVKNNNSTPLTEVKHSANGPGNLNAPKMNSHLSLIEKSFVKKLESKADTIVDKPKVSSLADRPKKSAVAEKENVPKPQVSVSSLNQLSITANSALSSASAVKVNATSSWNVTEMNLHSPSVASGSSTNSVNSTTDWNIVDQESCSKIDRNSMSSRPYSRKCDIYFKVNHTGISPQKQKLCSSNDKSILKKDFTATNNSLMTNIGKMELKNVCDSPSSETKLAKSPVTASTPNLCFPILESTSVLAKSKSEGSPRLPSSQSQSKPELATHLNKEPDKPFRNQSFQVSDSFLKSDGVKRHAVSKDKDSLKRSLDDDSQDSSSKRSSRFFYSHEDSNGSVHKKFKTNHLKNERKSTTLKRSSSPASDKIYHSRVVNSDSSLHVQKRHHTHKSKSGFIKTMSGTVKRTKNDGSHCDSDSSNSSSSQYEYDWVEKETVKISESESNSKVPSLSHLKTTGSKKSSDHETSSGFEHGHNKNRDVVTELQRNSSYLFGTEIGTWNNARRSPIRENKPKRYFDDYDDELDRGKERRRKKHYYEKNNYRHNPFQTFENDRNKKTPFHGNWSYNKHNSRNYHYQDRYYDKRYHKGTQKHFSRGYYNKHQNFHRH